MNESRFFFFFSPMRFFLRTRWKLENRDFFFDLIDVLRILNVICVKKC